MAVALPVARCNLYGLTIVHVSHTRGLISCTRYAAPCAAHIYIIKPPSFRLSRMLKSCYAYESREELGAAIDSTMFAALPSFHATLPAWVWLRRAGRDAGRGKLQMCGGYAAVLTGTRELISPRPFSERDAR